MKFTLVNLTAIVTLVITLQCACGGETTGDGAVSSTGNSNQIGSGDSEKSNPAQDDPAELGKIIKLPLLPEETIFWEENLNNSEIGNQNPVLKGKKIVAVLRYSPENSAQIISHIEKIKAPIDSEVDAESRFPAELIARSQLSGDESLKGKSYAADDFFQTPYTNGKITRVEGTDYFVLELTTN